MNITINTKIIKKYGITPDDYVWLHHKINGLPIEFLIKADVQRMQHLGLIKVEGKLIRLRPKLRGLFPQSDVSSWIQEYRNVFKGSRSHKSMGDKQAVLQKMKVFMTENPEYSKDEIVTAAERYINRCKMEGVPNRQAEFFIYKQEMVDGAMVRKSDLFSTLEDIENAVEVFSHIESVKSDTRW